MNDTTKPAKPAKPKKATQRRRVTPRKLHGYVTEYLDGASGLTKTSTVEDLLASIEQQIVAEAVGRG